MRTPTHTGARTHVRSHACRQICNTAISRQLLRERASVLRYITPPVLFILEVSVLSSCNSHWGNIRFLTFRRSMLSFSGTEWPINVMTLRHIPEEVLPHPRGCRNVVFWRHSEGPTLLKDSSYTTDHTHRSNTDTHSFLQMGFEQLMRVCHVPC